MEKKKISTIKNCWKGLSALIGITFSGLAFSCLSDDNNNIPEINDKMEIVHPVVSKPDIEVKEKVVMENTAFMPIALLKNLYRESNVQPPSGLDKIFASVIVEDVITKKNADFYKTLSNRDNISFVEFETVGNSEVYQSEYLSETQLEVGMNIRVNIELKQ